MLSAKSNGIKSSMNPAISPPKPCFEQGCPQLTHETYCDTHRKAHSKRYERSRPNRNARGYNYRWRKERIAFLNRHPLCVECLKHDVVTKATEVDHIVPHKGNQELFWNSENWQALCKSCHSAKTNAERGDI